MEDEICAGALNHLKVAALGKQKWNKRWAVLFKYSLYGTQRLEIYDTRESFDKRERNNRKHLTTINLENCCNIAENTTNEGKKNENVLKLSFSSDEKQQVFSWDSYKEMTVWLNALQSVVFGTNNNMDHDQVYEVQMKPSECTIKLNLEGVYLLIVSSEDIELVDKATRNSVMKWPLHLLRKYGRDKQEFSIEAGRRCPSGPGMFYFITDQYNEIFQEVENNVKSRASRSRAESTSSATNSFRGSFTSKFPHSSEPAPSSPRAPPSTSLYDDPLDVRKEKPHSKPDDYTYNEPFNLRPPPSAKTKSGKRSTKQSQEKSAGKNKPKSGVGAFKGAGAGPKKTSKKTPKPVVEEATYSEALAPNGLNENLTSEYSQLNLGPGTLVQDAEYDSITYPNQWTGAAKLDASSEYATTADFPGRFKNASQPDDSVYDHVKR